MQAIKDRYKYLFRSTKGLILVAIALISIETAMFGFLSGPMAEWGVRDWWANLLKMQLIEADREGRIILLYHTIAMAVVAIEVYMVTALVPMDENEQVTINGTITFGYIISMVCGIIFGYFGHNYVFHGLFIFGQAIIFFAGLLLAKALWPWQKRYHTVDPEKASTKGKVDLERVAFFVVAAATLGSALFGAVTGSMWGNGHEAFLAEDLIREPTKTPLQLAIIGHLHIMLTLIAAMLLLILGKWVNFRGKLHKWAMPLMITGTIIITLGVWSIIPYQPTAHLIINVGSFPVLIAALLLVIFGWRQQMRKYLAEKAIAKPTFGDRLIGIIHDPLKFGALWQMVFMNFVVTLVGIFMAVKLDEIFRVWPAREERIALTGHWHILSGIIATIILLYYADIAGLKGKVRQVFGWIIILFSDLAFAAVSVFETKRLFVSEAAQQPLVNTVVLLGDIGLGTVLLALAALMGWRLIDLFKKKGRWTHETEHPSLPVEEEVKQ